MKRPTKKNVDRPLECGTEDGQLVIRIGIKTLGWAAKKRNGGPLPNRYAVVDHLEFANDVARALMHEDEIGNTMLCDVFDQAFQRAADVGSFGLKYPI